MDEYDDDGATDPDRPEFDAMSPSRPIRAARPLIFDRRQAVADDEERTTFMDRSQSRPPPAPAPSAPSSRPSAPPRSSRGPRPQLPRVAIDEPTVFKPIASPRAPTPVRKSAPPPAAGNPARSATGTGPQKVMSWPAPPPGPREVATPQPSHSTAPRPAYLRETPSTPPPAPPARIYNTIPPPAPSAPRVSEPPPRPPPRAEAAQGTLESVSVTPPVPAPMPSSPPPVIVEAAKPAAKAPVLFVAPENPSLIPSELHSTSAVVKDRSKSDTSVVAKAKAGKRPPVYILAGGFGLLGTLLAFGAVLGITSVVRSSAAASGKITLHPPVVMAAAPAVTPLASPPTATDAPASPPAPGALTAQAATDTTAPAPVAVATSPASQPVASQPAPSQPSANLASADDAHPPRLSQPAAHVRTSRPFVRHDPPAAAPAPKVASNDAPPAAKPRKTGKASNADIDDAKEAEELARKQLEQSLK